MSNAVRTTARGERGGGRHLPARACTSRALSDGQWSNAARVDQHHRLDPVAVERQQLGDAAAHRRGHDGEPLDPEMRRAARGRSRPARGCRAADRRACPSRPRRADRARSRGTVARASARTAATGTTRADTVCRSRTAGPSPTSVYAIVPPEVRPATRRSRGRHGRPAAMASTTRTTRAISLTSCTRTTSTPSARAPRDGAGRALHAARAGSSTPVSSPMNRLRETPTRIGDAELARTIPTSSQELEVVMEVLAEPDARGRTQSWSRGTPAATAAPMPAGEEVAHLRDDVVVGRVLLHRLGLALHVHQHEPGAASFDERRASRGRRRPRRRSRCDAPAAIAAPRDLRLARVDADRDVGHLGAAAARSPGARGRAPRRRGRAPRPAASTRRPRRGCPRRRPPSAARASPRRRRSRNRPPSLNESGVTLTMPMSRVRSPQRERVLAAAPYGALSHAAIVAVRVPTRMPMWFMASWRVRASVRKSPRTAEVTVTEPGFLMPRIVMQRCSASITTNTPRGIERALDRVGDLRREPLLHLRLLRQDVHDARDLRQAGDLARLVRHVRHVRTTVERDQVVLAERRTAGCRAP